MLNIHETMVASDGGANFHVVQAWYMTAFGATLYRIIHLPIGIA